MAFEHGRIFQNDFADCAEHVRRGHDPDRPEQRRQRIGRGEFAPADHAAVALQRARVDPRQASGPAIPICSLSSSAEPNEYCPRTVKDPVKCSWNAWV